MPRRSEYRDAVVGFVDRYTVRRGVPPTVREIAHGLGYSSESTVWMYLKELRDAGRLTWQPGKSRTVQVVREVSDE